MKATLLVSILFFLRLGIPAIVLLTIGEIIRRHTGNLTVGGD